jgi:hypothetical protein
VVITRADFYFGDQDQVLIPEDHFFDGAENFPGWQNRGGEVVVMTGWKPGEKIQIWDLLRGLRFQSVWRP